MVNEVRLKLLEEFLAGLDLKTEILKYTVEKDGKIFCIFHDESVPSLYVNEAKNVWYCFSCGRGGGFSKFLFHIEEHSSTGSVRYFDVLEKYLKDNRDVCAELGFYSIYDGFNKNKKVVRGALPGMLEGLKREERLEKGDYTFNKSRPSVDEIIAISYKLQINGGLDDE